MRIRMQHEFKILIPSECSCREKLPEELRTEVKKEVHMLLDLWFVGATEEPGNGTWVDERHGRDIAVEKLDIITSNATAATYLDHREAFLELVNKVGFVLCQNEAAATIDGVLHRIKLDPRDECCHDETYEKVAVEPPDADRHRLIATLHRLTSPDKAIELARLLHYPIIDEDLSTGNWSEAARALLFSDMPPRLIAAKGGFEIIWCALGDEKLRADDQRAVCASILRETPGWMGLLVFCHPKSGERQLVNIKSGGRLTRNSGPILQRLRLLKDTPVSNAVRKIELLGLNRIGQNATGAEIQATHEEVFSVQGLTNTFFRQYKEVFEKVKAALKPGSADDAQVHLFAQTLLNRLMFVAFVEKKGWLTLGGSTAYLQSLWDAYRQQYPDRNLFYSERLRPLFFGALNTPPEERNAHLADTIGEAPYLNGGLFAEEEWERSTGIEVPDCAADSILDLFARYDFTVAETTELDRDADVDPEMLGHVFEKLIISRKEQGAYYTPRPVVVYMCREAMKGYLCSRVPDERPEAVAEFVDDHDASALRYPERVLEALKAVRVCDPACGSGAYLLGMLHELMALRSCLFAPGAPAPEAAYESKLEIIKNNLFGVDLDGVAVNIAKLRLWLSLMVDYNGATPPPLPNLDFRIEQGDSLSAPNPQDLVSGGLFRHEALKVIAKLAELRSQYLTAHGRPKARLSNQIKAKEDELRTIVAGSGYPQLPENALDWRTAFGDVFAVVNNAGGGFDIVLANPPYVRADAQFKEIDDPAKRKEAEEQHSEERNALATSGIYQTLCQRWDLYIPFLERGHQLLAPRGRMVFIIPDAYNCSQYAAKSRQFFLEGCTVESIDFCTDIRLFEAGVTNTILHAVKQPPAAEHTPRRTRRSGDGPEDFDSRTEVLPTKPQRELGELLFRAATPSPPPSECFLLGDICYISKGMVIHADERRCRGAFKAADLVADQPDGVPRVPYVEGKDIRRWGTTRTRYLEYGTARTPAQFSRPTFEALHTTSPHIVVARLGDGPQRAALASEPLYTNHTVSVCVPWCLFHGLRNDSIKKTARYADENGNGPVPTSLSREKREEMSKLFKLEYVLAVINSSSAGQWLDANRRGKMDLYPNVLKGLPIPDASPADQAAIAELAQKCLDAKGVGCEEWEAEINERVAALYGL